MNKIYTKTGDSGETGLFGGERASKDSLRVRVIGEIDELNACLGVCRALNKDEWIDKVLGNLQKDLFGWHKIHPLRVEHLEQMINGFSADLEPLESFILPGGSLAAAKLHVARTVCRRAERALVALGKNEEVGKAVVPYFNRLSDLLFVMARFVNVKDGFKEEKA